MYKTWQKYDLIRKTVKIAKLTLYNSENVKKIIQEYYFLENTPVFQVYLFYYYWSQLQT
jgi:hypothetical protein